MVKILNSSADISRGLNSQFLDQINARLAGGIGKVRQSVASAISFHLWNDATTKELLSGGTSLLVSVLGLDSASSRVDSVIQCVANSVHITYKPYRLRTAYKPVGMFQVELLNINEVVNLPSAEIISTNGGYNWLNMLLLAGDTIFSLDLDYGHLFLPQKNIKQSRTEHGLVIANSKNLGALRIPAEFSGVESDNWLTRALSRQEFLAELEQIVISLIA